jgi:hypothetical protein
MANLPTRLRVEARFLALAAGAMLASTLGSAPAAAQQDVGVLGNLFQNILGGGSSAPEIDYRERSPLVVPPRSTLPPPQQRAQERAGNWPNDPDVQRRRAAEDAGIFDGVLGRPRAQVEGARIRMSPNELAEGRTQAEALRSRDPWGNQPNSILDDSANSLLRLPQQQMRASDAQRAQQRIEEPVGTEPPRRLLTDPPPGLRAGTQRIAPAPDAPIDRSDDLGVRQFQRQQARR